ncbi:hypothetical protein [Sphingobacterium anhuiense]|uniref:Uncharacterized protein n=1 Tax=Sphingobacterium anhuiense TaxID=493780 RepID=A0ABW5YXT6_9SPHI
MKSLILISSFLVLLWQNQKEVYLLKDADGQIGIEYNKIDKDVNIIISDRLIRDNLDKKAIKMYLASFFIPDKGDIQRDFKKLFNISMSDFAKNQRQEICRVIYYLEHEDHGNLPLIYNHEAYKLLDIKELKPDIEEVKMKLENSGMLLIDIDADVKTKDLKSIKLK